MASYLRPRRGKKTTAESQSLVLKRGEIFFETPAAGTGAGIGKLKMGDGTSTYQNLPYFGSTEDDTVAFTDTSAATESTNNPTYLTNIRPSNPLKTVFTNLKQLLYNHNSQLTQLNNDLSGFQLREVDGKAQYKLESEGADAWRPFNNGGESFNNNPNILSDDYPQDNFFWKSTIIANSTSSRFSKLGTNSVVKTTNSLTISSSCGTGAGGSGIDFNSNILVYTPPVSKDFSAVHYKIDSTTPPGKTGYNDNKIILENLITGESFDVASLNSVDEQTITIPSEFKANLFNNMMRLVLCWGAYDGNGKTVVLSKLEYID